MYMSKRVEDVIGGEYIYTFFIYCILRRLVNVRYCYLSSANMNKSAEITISHYSKIGKNYN